MGQRAPWRLQQFRARPTEERTADPSLISSFCRHLRDGSVVTWGNYGLGGDSSALQDQLKNVQQIQASNYAFAAILGDGFVGTWGSERFGSDGSSAEDQLQSVQQIHASKSAFAAFVTWGFGANGGDHPGR